MNRETALSILRNHFAELADAYHIENMMLFGSVARNEASPDSDVDLLVSFSQPVNLFKFIGLKQKLESLLGCNVDLGTKISLKTEFQEQLLTGAIYVN